MYFFERLQADLELRKKQGNYRELPMTSFRQDNILFDSERYIDLASNDYLCVARDSHFINEFFATFTDKEASGSQFAQQILNSFINSGSTGSRLLTGNQIAYTYCEDLLASLFNRTLSCPWSPDAVPSSRKSSPYLTSDGKEKDISLTSFAQSSGEVPASYRPSDAYGQPVTFHERKDAAYDASYLGQANEPGDPGESEPVPNYGSESYYGHDQKSFSKSEQEFSLAAGADGGAGAGTAGSAAGAGAAEADGAAARKRQATAAQKAKAALASQDLAHLGEQLKELTPRNRTGQAASEPKLSAVEASAAVIKRTRNLDQQDMARDCLYLNSGFDANAGVLSTLFCEKDLLLVDKLAHASIIDGMLHSKAKAIRFAHNDMEHLSRLLEAYAHKYENVVIVTEAVFSMDGDRANLPAIIGFKQYYPNLLIYIDEAHSFGLLGEGGLGLCQELDVLDSVDFIMGTLSKAIGSQGAFLICPRVVKQYLINHMRNFIYSTALPPFNVAFSMYIVGMLNTTVMQYRRDYLNKICNYLHLNLLEMDLTPSESQIQPLITGDNNKAAYVSEVFKRAGLLALPIRHPTVPINQVRLRLSLNCNLRIDDVDLLCSLIKRYRNMFR